MRPQTRTSSATADDLAIQRHGDEQSQSPTSELPAGRFSDWLRHARDALLHDIGTDVACGDCTACCSSSYFIHVRPTEAQTLKHIPKKLLSPAPSMPKGHQLMGYTPAGHCPMLQQNQCSIYHHRPQTCRNYDCRVFAAAGISAGDASKQAINERVQRWRFSYPSQLDRDEHEAVKAAARFIQHQADHFPGGRIPTNPSQLAILALKVYEVFLPGYERKPEAEIAQQVVEASRDFDSRSRIAGDK